MAEPNQNNNDQNSGHNSEPPVNAGNKERNEQIQGRNPRRQSRTQASHQPQVYKRIIRFLAKKDKQPHFANFIAFVALIIGIILAYYTYKVFNLSQIQAQSVIDAGNAAKKSADVARETLDSIISVQKRTDISDKERYTRDTATFNLQRQALNTQIISLNENQKEFEIANRPYITITDLEITDYEVGKISSITFSFLNVGKLSAKIIATHIGAKTTVDDNFKPQKLEKQIENVNQFIAPGLSITNWLKAGEVIDNKMYDSLFKSKNFIYVYGIIKYRGFNNKQIYYIRFNFRMSEFPHKNTTAMQYESN